MMPPHDDMPVASGDNAPPHSHIAVVTGNDALLGNDPPPISGMSVFQGDVTPPDPPDFTPPGMVKPLGRDRPPDRDRPASPGPDRPPPGYDSHNWLLVCVKFQRSEAPSRHACQHFPAVCLRDLGWQLQYDILVVISGSLFLWIFVLVVPELLAKFCVLR